MESVIDWIGKATEPNTPCAGEERALEALDPYCRKVAEVLSDAFLDELLSALARLQDCYTGEAFRRGFCLGDRPFQPHIEHRLHVLHHIHVLIVQRIHVERLRVLSDNLQSFSPTFHTSALSYCAAISRCGGFT